MSKLYIGEYLTPDCHEPAVTEQVLEIESVSNASAPFNRQTRAVRVHADVPCSVKFGEDPVASISNQRLAANQTETRIVPSVAGFKLAVIANEGDDTGFNFGALDQQLKARGIQ
jgi:hypothetical protein